LHAREDGFKPRILADLLDLFGRRAVARHDGCGSPGMRRKQ
jgi:hypothetical protein